MKTRYLLTAITGLTLIGVGAAAHRYRGAGALVSTPIANAAHVTELEQEQAVGPIRNLRFTLFDAGIRPGRMRIKAGLVNIHIEDRTNTSQGVTIQRVAGGERVAVGSVQKVAAELRGRSFFRLAPGEYELFDATKPANKAVLLVEP
jgi:hypothetical protein